MSEGAGAAGGEVSGGLAASHVGICVADLEASIRFYRDGLGYALAERFDLGTSQMPGIERSLEVDGPVDVVSQMMVLGGHRIELLYYPDGRAHGIPSATRDQKGLTHLSYRTHDVDSVAAQMVACGGTVLENTRTNVGIQLLFLADPDGTRIELMGA
ncbi:MAG TPA: VOC family protein [Acidimicrobiales bacterium]|nr:VOC family protein [Acidimicrobiales bacterium]